METDKCFMNGSNQKHAEMLMNSPEMRAIAKKLTEQHQGLMNEAIQAFQSGDYLKAKELLQPLTCNSEIKDALKKAGGKIG